jgi:N-acetylglucosamine kinase-like BadF-type ATPase
MANLLKEAFPQAERVEAHGDLLGAARALCGRNEGIASILGTGANSCLYDGEAILQNTPPLGYILGDEGSGAVLGKLLVNALYKGRLSNEIVADFQRQTGLDMPAVIARVYRQPMANRFLASLCPFIHDHLGDPCLKSLVIDAFRDFFRINIAPYRRRDLPVAFVGSVAWFFSEQLTEAAAAEGFCVGTVCRSPLLGLLRYHAV